MAGATCLMLDYGGFNCLNVQMRSAGVRKEGHHKLGLTKGARKKSKIVTFRSKVGSSLAVALSVVKSI